MTYASADFFDKWVPDLAGLVLRN